MAYLTQADYTTRYGEDELQALCDRDQTGVIDAEVFAAAITRVEATLDGYLRPRYGDSLPLTPPLDAALHGVALELTRYWLHADHRPAEVQMDYENALAWLKDLRAGRYTLDLPVPEDAVSTGVAYTTRVAAFTPWTGGWNGE